MVVQLGGWQACRQVWLGGFGSGGWRAKAHAAARLGATANISCSKEGFKAVDSPVAFRPFLLLVFEFSCHGDDVMHLSRHCHTAFCGLSLSLLLSPLALAAAPAQSPPPPAVTVEVVQVATQPLVLEYPALTAGYRQVQVRAQVNGILRERSYVEGSKVKQGQVLFVIDQKPYEAALARAKGAQAQ